MRMYRGNAISLSENLFSHHILMRRLSVGKIDHTRAREQQTHVRTPLAPDRYLVSTLTLTFTASCTYNCCSPFLSRMDNLLFALISLGLNGSQFTKTITAVFFGKFFDWNAVFLFAFNIWIHWWHDSWAHDNWAPTVEPRQLSLRRLSRATIELPDSWAYDNWAHDNWASENKLEIREERRNYLFQSSENVSEIEQSSRSFEA